MSRLVEPKKNENETTIDDEMEALKQITQAFMALDSAARDRVMWYLTVRFNLKPVNALQGTFVGGHPVGIRGDRKDSQS